MSALSNSILEKVLRPELRATVLLPTTGTVRRTYSKAMKLDVVIRAPWSGSEVALRRVPMAAKPGMANPMPRTGDMVTIAFQGTTLQSAVVLGTVDDNFKTVGREATAHPEKGATIPDLM